MLMISAVLELCTSHVTQNDMEQLENEKDFTAGSYEHGVFICVPAKENYLTKYSASLAKVFELAREKNCRFVLLDCDAPEHDSDKLDHHEW